MRLRISAPPVFMLASLIAVAALPAGCGSKTSTASAGSTGAGAGSTASVSTTSASGSGGSSGGIAACGTYQPGDDLHVCAATYLGASGASTLGAVAVAPDGTIVVGGALPGDDLGQTPVTLLGGTSGAVLRLDPTGRKVLSLTRIGAQVTDLEVDPASGAIAVSGDFGVAVLDAEAAAVTWHASAGGAIAKIGRGSDGTVAALSGSTVQVFSPTGATLASFTTNATSVNDVAVDGASKSVFVTGYLQDNGGACTDYKSTFLRSFDYTGVAKWKDYDWTHADVGASGDCADTQGLALGMGRDGKLYYAGRSDGGNTVHAKDPRNLSAMAPNVETDAYNTPYGFSGANALGYYARFDPATGLIEKGQFILTRLGTSASAQANAAVPAAVTADEKGNVFVAGDVAYEIENHDAKQINGVTVGPYVAYEAFALIVPSDFSTRLTWAVFTKTGPADGISIAAAAGGVAFGATQSAADVAKGSLLTVDPLEAQPGTGASTAFLSVWPAP